MSMVSLSVCLSVLGTTGNIVWSRIQSESSFQSAPWSWVSKCFKFCRAEIRVASIISPLPAVRENDAAAGADSERQAEPERKLNLNTFVSIASYIVPLPLASKTAKTLSENDTVPVSPSSFYFYRPYDKMQRFPICFLFSAKSLVTRKKALMSQLAVPGQIGSQTLPQSLFSLVSAFVGIVEQMRRRSSLWTETEALCYCCTASDVRSLRCPPTRARPWPEKTEKGKGVRWNDGKGSFESGNMNTGIHDSISRRLSDLPLYWRHSWASSLRCRRWRGLAWVWVVA